jgi:hypothetical protein
VGDLNIRTALTIFSDKQPGVLKSGTIMDGEFREELAERPICAADGPAIRLRG